MPRHKVFVSYHHANDQVAKDTFVRRFCEVWDGFVDRSVHDGDIPDGVPTDEIRRRIRDEFIADATVTIVLIGTQTWQRKHVDWELSSSLRDTKHNPRTGLLGILLPSYTVPGEAMLADRKWTDPIRQQYWPYNIPPRLWENVASGFAAVRPMPQMPGELDAWIHEAFVRRDKNPPPTLAYPSFANNRPEHQTRWTY